MRQKPPGGLGTYASALQFEGKGLGGKKGKLPLGASASFLRIPDSKKKRELVSVQSISQGVEGRMTVMNGG